MAKSKKLIDTLPPEPGDPDILAGLEAPPELRLTEVEHLKRQLLDTKIKMAQMQYQLASERKERLLKEIDPKGLLAKLDKEIFEATEAIKDHIREWRSIEEGLKKRLGVDVSSGYKVEEDGRLTPIVP